MKLNIALIRNGLTGKSTETPFLGAVEESLTPASRARLKEKMENGVYPQAQIVYTSGIVRCRETAGILYPNIPAIIMKELRAFDCGEMLGKKYRDLKKDKRFRDWGAASVLTSFPGGEDPHQFFVRSSFALQNIATEMSNKGIVSASVITHRAVIRTIVRRFCIPRFYCDGWALDGGGGYLLEFDIYTKLARILDRL